MAEKESQENEGKLALKEAQGPQDVTVLQDLQDSQVLQVLQDLKEKKVKHFLQRDKSVTREIRGPEDSLEERAWMESLEFPD